MGEQVAEDNGDARRLYERCGFRLQQHTGDEPLQLLRRPILRAMLGSPAWLRMRKQLPLPHSHAAAGAAHSTAALPACTAGSEQPANTCNSSETMAASKAESEYLASAAGKSRAISLTAFQPGHPAGSWQSAAQGMGSTKLKDTVGPAPASCEQPCLAPAVQHAAGVSRARTACKRFCRALHLYLLLLACR